MNESDRQIEFEVVFEDAGRRFDVAVAGPLLLGRTRHKGGGLFSHGDSVPLPSDSG